MHLALKEVVGFFSSEISAASGSAWRLVALAVFKTVVRGDPSWAGSIPVHFRLRFSCEVFGVGAVGAKRADVGSCFVCDPCVAVGLGGTFFVWVGSICWMG